MLNRWNIQGETSVKRLINVAHIVFYMNIIFLQKLHLGTHLNKTFSKAKIRFNKMFNHTIKNVLVKPGLYIPQQMTIPETAEKMWGHQTDIRYL